MQVVEERRGGGKKVRRETQRARFEGTRGRKEKSRPIKSTGEKERVVDIYGRER